MSNFSDVPYTTDLMGYELHVLAEDKRGNPEIMYAVVRTTDELRKSLADMVDGDTGAFIDTNFPELKDGLPAGKMVCLLLLNGAKWVIPTHETQLGGKNGWVDFTFLKSETPIVCAHVCLTALHEKPLRINAQFHDPFQDEPKGPQKSPRRRGRPRDLAH